MMIDLRSGRLKLRGFVEPPRLPSPMSSGCSIGTVRMTLFWSGTPSRPPLCNRGLPLASMPITHSFPTSWMLSSNCSETWIRLAPTSLAPLLPFLPHQHLPDRILRCSTSPSPLHPLHPLLTPQPVLQAAPFASFAPLLVMLRPNASSSSISCIVSTPLINLQLPLPPLHLSHFQTPHSPPQLPQQVPFLPPHSSMTLTPPGMQTLAPQLIWLAIITGCEIWSHIASKSGWLMGLWCTLKGWGRFASILWWMGRKWLL